MRLQGISKKIKVLLFKFLKIDITSIAIKKQFFSYQENLKGFDIVQLINESPIGMMPHPERAMDAQMGSADGQALFRALVGLTGAA